MADVDAIETEIEQIRAALNQLQDIDEPTKTMQIKADKSKCFATNGGKVSGDLDMQDFRICNLPEAKAAEEPITNGWHARHYTYAIISFRREVSALESKINAFYPKGRKLSSASDPPVEGRGIALYLT